MLNKFLQDKAILIKQNQPLQKEFLALFDKDKIITDDTSLPVEEGDCIIRTLPNGLTEKYHVLDRGFYSKHGGIPAHYQMKVEKESSKNRQTPAISQIHIENNNGKINFDSIDNSYNVTNNYDSRKIFEDLTQLSVGLENEQEIRDNINKMKKTVATKSFSKYYNSFIQSISAHMTLFAPLIPKLTKLLS